MFFFALNASFFSTVANAQINLINNSGFETFSDCPNSFAEICLATPWFQPLNCLPPSGVCNCGSSDYFNDCSGNSLLDVPLNVGGYQQAKNGLAYSGISVYTGTWSPDLWREYIEIRLNSQLNTNKNYCVSWFYNLSDNSRYGCNRIGAYFSEDTLFQIGNQYENINVIPQVENINANSDTINWTLYKQIFSAQGNEFYMTIGNFRPGNMVDTSTIINSDGSSTYYYFDDFGVYELPEIDAGSGASICEYGGSAQLQANCEGCWDGLLYRWWPSVGLSDSTVLNPTATPEQTTTYYFGLIDTTETVPCIVDLVDSVTVTVCAGIEPPAFNFSIQPNPGQDQVELHFTHVSEDTDLFLYDMRGKLILKDRVLKDSESYTLNLLNLANAQYMLKLQNSSATVRKKLMKM